MLCCDKRSKGEKMTKIFFSSQYLLKRGCEWKSRETARICSRRACWVDKVDIFSTISCWTLQTKTTTELVSGNKIIFFPKTKNEPVSWVISDYEINYLTKSCSRAVMWFSVLPEFHEMLPDIQRNVRSAVDEIIDARVSHELRLLKGVFSRSLRRQSFRIPNNLSPTDYYPFLSNFVPFPIWISVRAANNQAILNEKNHLNVDCNTVP